MSAINKSNPVTDVMRKRRVAPIPRNYELFYEALLGSNSKLSAELVALGIGPLQPRLDELHAKYIGKMLAAELIDAAHESLGEELSQLKALLCGEETAMQDHGKSLKGLQEILKSSQQISLGELGKSILEIQSHTRNVLEAHADTIDHVGQSAEDIQVMRRQLKEYKRLAYIDALTGLFNRRAFDERLSMVFDAPRSTVEHALILADIDHFKRVNDKHGHPAGDKVLVGIAKSLSKYASRSVFIARPGGEEFAVLMENTNVAEAARVAEMVRLDIANRGFIFTQTDPKPETLSISLGISMRSDAACTAEFYENSDLALYAAKSDGRNRHRVYSRNLRGNLSGNRILYQTAS
jgi:diguanylate cyclase